ncbi:hypothetical protein [Streptomyces sp. UNOC14_S4]|uniref:hypothetical protein n=1 Tax=Streptomyces sp. UNOC14_S4 TaxID=2872340 RepID=UPI001E4C0F62|nr:hypothetical protein [Streptomyces sp. UNOC14_S4]MCC3766152.1 hypothetical protein [Streptomyces sp. UNOC14_S4]
MVTARSPFGIRRVARARGSVSRLLWLGALLFALFSTHGLGMESGSGHVTASMMVSSSATAAAATSDGDRAEAPHDADASGSHPEQGDDAHPGGECLSGKPQDDPLVDEPTAVGHSVLTADVGQFPAAPCSAAATVNARATEYPHQAANLRI